jgi:hypothetical protein
MARAVRSLPDIHDNGGKTPESEELKDPPINNRTVKPGLLDARGLEILDDKFYNIVINRFMFAWMTSKRFAWTQDNRIRLTYTFLIPILRHEPH